MKADDTDKTLENWQAARKEMRRLQGEHNKAVEALDTMRATQETALAKFDADLAARRGTFIAELTNDEVKMEEGIKTLWVEYDRAVVKVRTLGTKMQSSVGDEVSRDQGSIAGGLRKSAEEKVAQVQADFEAAAAKAEAERVAEAPSPRPDEAAQPLPAD